MTQEHALSSQDKTHINKSDIPDPNASQARASSPESSVWVGASAGTGKTKVLTDRVLRLLLPHPDGQPGTELHKILCLTFTKAAASEMAHRIHNTLASWSTMPEQELKKTLRKLIKRDVSNNDVSTARQLFSKITDQNENLKIQTIHAFCQSVLGRFPLEAGIVPLRKIAEESDSNAMLQHATSDTLKSIANEPASPDQQAFAHLSRTLNETHLMDLLRDVVGERIQFDTLTSAYFGPDGLYQALCNDLQIPSNSDPQQIVYEACLNKNFDQSGLKHVCEIIAQHGSKTDQAKQEKIAKFLESTPQERAHIFMNEYRYAFFKSSDHEPYKKLITNKISNHDPKCATILEAEQDRIFQTMETLKSIYNARDTHHILSVSNRVINTYKDIKTKRAVLDYEDLIFYTLRLLKNPKSMLWVMYKMDHGLEHILVDEAQDTNPEQWQIIDALCDNFFSGHGTREEKDKERTVFVVGDEKQSIYSFQRASPEKFNLMQESLRTKAQNAQATWTDVDMDISFRSTQNVLDVVDQVFPQQKHYSFRTGQGGTVELWPLSEPDNFTPPIPWDGPFKIHEKRSETTVLAQKIARKIDDWLKNKEHLASRNRPIKPEDIMILVRTRTGALVYEIMRQCKLRGVPVGGLDRLILQDEIAIQDLLAIGHWTLCPADDLTLACILKSPFIGLTEDQLYDLARERPENLWKTLSSSAYKDICVYLSTLKNIAGQTSPYDFFNTILQSPCPADKHSGLRALQMRLGQPCKDPIEEFLNVALQAGKNQNTKTVHDFIYWFTRENIEVKREQNGNESVVRIMTVHGAKGLQAPIVILPDTTSTPQNAPRHAGKRLLWPDKTGLNTPIFARRKNEESALYRQAMENIKARELAEYKRLLYVAMTRAEDRLYIAGARKKREPSEQCWYNQIKQAMESLGNTKTLEDGTLQFHTPSTREGDRINTDDTQDKNQNITDLPNWMLTPIISKNDFTISAQTSQTTQADEETRYERGRIIHKLLEILPNTPPNARPKFIESHLTHHASSLSKNDKINIADTVLRIINNHDLAWLFGKNSRAEIPITYTTNNGVSKNYVIDRLVVTEKSVWIVDYKTDQKSLTTPEKTPQQYTAQLKRYANAIGKIYPDHEIKTAILWAQNGQFMEIKTS